MNTTDNPSPAASRPAITDLATALRSLRDSDKPAEPPEAFFEVLLASDLLLPLAAASAAIAEGEVQVDADAPVELSFLRMPSGQLAMAVFSSAAALEQAGAGTKHYVRLQTHEACRLAMQHEAAPQMVIDFQPSGCLVLGHAQIEGLANRLTPHKWADKVGEMIVEEENLEAAVEANPDDAAAWMLLGDSYANSGKLDDAKRAYKRCIKLDPPAKLVSEAKQRLRAINKRAV